MLGRIATARTAQSMRVQEVRISNFRNHAATELEFGEGINALLGNNGQGKTNVLEALSYLSLTKSFYAVNDATALRIGEEAFEVEGTLVTDAGASNTVRVAYARAGEKLFTINGARPETLASVIGRFPLVVLSPENNAITFGGPSERRRFMDLLLSQIRRAYLEDLIEYRRALKQRNRLLLEAKTGGRLAPEMLAPWTAALIRLGGRIAHCRKMFAAEFREYVQRTYRDLVSNGVDRREAPDISYASLQGIADSGDVEATSALLAAEFNRRESEEWKRGTTLAGPHRDDLELSIDGISVQRYASQGQHKTMLIALKMAEFFYLRERCDETPILLLDDVFSELDETRSRLLLNALNAFGQTFVTTTDEKMFHGTVQWNDRNRRFAVEAGRVRTGTGALL